MNLGLRAILLIVAIVAFVIAIFSDTNWPECIAIGLACTVGSFLVSDLGWDRPIGTGGRRST